MEVCSLYPPNRKSLSDQVIRDVAQHSRSSRVDTSLHRSALYSTHNVAVGDMPGAYFVATKRPSGIIDPSEDDAIDNRKNRRRERCRVNQARYRERQLKQAADLETYVLQLQGEVIKLEKERSKAPARALKRYNVWTVATEYLRVFRHGCRLPSKSQQTAALEFLQATMAPDASDGGMSGLLEDWIIFSECFSEISVELVRIDKAGPFGSVVVTTSTSVTISEVTLRRAFPHLNSDGEGGVNGGKWSSLAAKLLSQRITMSGSVLFHWDPTTERVANLQAQADMLTPILRLVGNLEDTSLVFKNALMAPNGHVVGGGRRHELLRSLGR